MDEKMELANALTDPEKARMSSVISGKDALVTSLAERKLLLKLDVAILPLTVFLYVSLVNHDVGSVLNFFIPAFVCLKFNLLPLLSTDILLLPPGLSLIAVRLKGAHLITSS
jgi:hypothetical protein